jgi:hypothetical protein
MLLKRLTFIVSIFAFVYFAYLLLMYLTKTEFPTIAGAVHEMVIFPLMIGVPVFLIISIVLVIRERFNFRSASFYSLMMLLAAATILFLLMKGYFELETT